MTSTQFDWSMMKNIQKIHRVLYAIGLGPLIGRIVLLLTTMGRKSGLARVTPLQYEEINCDYYLGSARGLKADWLRNIQANPNVEIRVGAKRLRGEAEVITDPSRIADFMEVRLERHPRMIGLIMEKAHGLPRRPTRAQLEELAKTGAFVIVHPTGMLTRRVGWSDHHKRSKITLILVTSLLVFAAIAFWTVWRIQTPKKPDSIPQGDYSFSIEYAEARIAQLMKSKHLPSVAVTLIDDQDIIWQETFGTANLEENAPAESNTVYKLWSVAKVFTAIEVMRLVEEGAVDLDAPITDCIPDFSIRSRFADPGQMTIRSLLTHRSGLPRQGCQWVDFSPDALPALVASLEDCHLAYPPHYRFKYSNIGIDTLGLIIEELRGTLFPVYMRENLLVPIGMNDSAFMRSQIPDQRHPAPGYEYYDGEYYPYEQHDIANMPSGNLYSTIEDMGTFVKFIFRDGKANGEQIIHPETLEAMVMVQTTSARDPQPMGLGWKIAQVFGSERMVWHDGGPSEGTGALVAFLPERKLGVALIANGATFDGSVSVSLAMDILETMLETKYGVTVPQEKPQEVAEIDQSILQKYAGKYVAFGDVMDVSLNGKRLKGSIQGFTFNLNPLDENTFQPNHWLANIGLASLLGVPIDLRQLKVEFMAGDEIDDDAMIINMGGVSYEICPKYPEIEGIPLPWEELIGEYDLAARLPSGAIGQKDLGDAAIWIENDVLQMGGVVGPILPISETEIVILSGPFAGETMMLDPETGNIYHQNYVYIRR